MKIKEIRTNLLYNYTEFIIRFERGQEQEIINFESNLKISPDKDYDVSIKPVRQKRSLDANAYFWILCKKLASKLRQPESDIYRHIIEESGVFEVIPIKRENVARWTEIWQSKGIGWICINLGESRKLKGYDVVRNYYGSSTYNSEEMARLIDNIILECKEQGIETLPPDEVNRLLAEWS